MCDVKRNPRAIRLRSQMRKQRRTLPEELFLKLSREKVCFATQPKCQQARITLGQKPLIT